jgi:hypothetical protein
MHATTTASISAPRAVLARASSRHASRATAARVRRVASTSSRFAPAAPATSRPSLRVAAAPEGEDTGASSPGVETPAPKPPSSSTPGVGKPPINPAFLALGDFTAATLITLVARGVAGQEVLGAGTLAAAAPFIVGWVGAGYFAGDYDSDSPNAALWGDAPRAITTGALTWFSGSAFAILLRNIEGGMMTFPPVLDEKVEFAGALGLICAFRAVVAVTKPGAE